MRRPLSQAKRGTATKGTRIPDDFQVTPEMVGWAREHAPDVDGRAATEAFVDFWRGRAGREAVKVDWVATWRNWLRKDQAAVIERRARASPLGANRTDQNIRSLLQPNGQPNLLALPGGAQ